MKTQYYNYIFIFILMGLMIASCGGNKQKAFIYLDNPSWEEIIECAKKENKGIILSLSTGGCTLCSKLLSDMEEDENMQASIKLKYIYARLDYNNEENEWITLVTGITKFPTYLVFNQNFELRGLLPGYVNKNLFLSRLNEIDKGNIQCMQEQLYNPLVLKEMKRVTPEQLLSAVQNNIEAQYCWDQYCVTMDSSSLNQAITHLDKSVKLFPDIYNQYLLAASYMQKMDTANGKIFAEKALALANSNVRPLYIKLRTELRKILDENYDKYDDPYMEFKEQNMQIDTLVFGQERMLSFVLYNYGRKTMDIDTVDATCSCMEVVPFKKNIDPGDSIVIQINLMAEGLGDFYRNIFVLSNAANSPQLLTISGYTKENCSYK